MAGVLLPGLPPWPPIPDDDDNKSDDDGGGGGGIWCGRYCCDDLGPAVVRPLAPVPLTPCCCCCDVLDARDGEDNGEDEEVTGTDDDAVMAGMAEEVVVVDEGVLVEVGCRRCGGGGGTPEVNTDDAPREEVEEGCC